MLKQSLNGRWRVKELNGETWHEAEVPGSVYSALIADGTLPDPFWRENEQLFFDLMRKDYALNGPLCRMRLSCAAVGLCFAASDWTPLRTSA